MALTEAKVDNLKVTATIRPQVVSPLSDTIPINVGALFENVANLRSITGSFTPANDTKIIAAIPAGASPNFIFLLVDNKVLVQTYAVSGQIKYFSSAPVSKILMLTMPPTEGSGDPFLYIVLDGRSVMDYAMAQGVLVNYTLIYGQATIT